MKTLTTLLFFLAISTAHAQQNSMFITMAGGTNTNANIDLHTAFGYQYSNAAIEAGIIAAPLQTAIPLYTTVNLSYTFAVKENWFIVPVAGIGYKYMRPGKYANNGFRPCAGARFQWKDYFFQSTCMDNTIFISIGFKGFFKEQY